MQVYLRLIRVQSWVKNLFLLAPLVFSFNLFNTALYQVSLLAFGAFCFLSSSVYVFNDILDADADKAHPRKKQRPIPSGEISASAAMRVGLLCLLMSAMLTYVLQQPKFAYALVTYLIINIAYVLKLKHISLVDGFCIASGFVLRVLAGCYAISVVPSDWIVVVTFFLALFLAFGKRKSELMLLDKEAQIHRKALKGYSVQTLDVFIYTSAAIAITAYLMYTLTSTTIPEHLHQPLKYSAFFVVFGLFRYIQLINDYESVDGDPTLLVYKDRLLQVTILLWVIYAIAVFYGA